MQAIVSDPWWNGFIWGVGFSGVVALGMIAIAKFA